MILETALGKARRCSAGSTEHPERSMKGEEMTNLNQRARWWTSPLLIAFALLAALTGVACAHKQGTHHGPGKLLASDTSESRSLNFWGSVDCENTTRSGFFPSGGDPHPRADGKAQHNRSFRRLTVIDGDNFYGERCELGLNYAATPGRGPTVFYRNGGHRVTWISIRLPKNFIADQAMWQTVMQMKQTQPYDSDVDSQGTPGTPILDLEVMNGEWFLLHPNLNPASAPCHANHSLGICWRGKARKGQWTRFSFDIVYSNNPKVGSIRVSADLNADGDFKDGGERSPLIHAATLRTESAPETTLSGGDGLAVGDAIPSHLRTGIYHDPAYSCRAPRGCSIDIDNVQVVRPRSKKK
jgi:hypothetical protein